MLCSNSGVVITKIINNTNARSSSGVMLMSLSVTKEFRCENRRISMMQSWQSHSLYHYNAIKRRCRKDQEQHHLQRRDPRMLTKHARVEFFENALVQTPS